MNYSVADSIKILDSYRKSGESRAIQVVEIGKPLVESGKIKDLKDDAWNLYEQIAIASLKTSDFSLAMDCIKALTLKFPNSKRVAKLLGMEFEAKGQYNQALEKYNELLEIDPSNSAVLKRKLAVLLPLGEIEEAIKSLVTYVDVFPNDSDAWVKLCELYLNEHMYAQAGFCVEELILLAPNNYFYHLKYAEIQYTLGNFDTALSYYLKVTELSRDNIHGFYGVKLCTSRFLSTLGKTTNFDNKKRGGNQPSNLTSRSVETLTALNELAAERILHGYSCTDNILEKLANISIDLENDGKPSAISQQMLEEWLKL